MKTAVLALVFVAALCQLATAQEPGPEDQCISERTVCISTISLECRIGIEDLNALENDCCEDYREFIDCLKGGECSDINDSDGLTENVVQRECPSEEARDCFPAHAKAFLEDGSSVRMDQLKTGDKVLTSAGKYSDVFSWSHRESTSTTRYVHIETAEAAIELSKGHYLPVNGELTAAGAAKVGDVVELATGHKSQITATSLVTRVGRYNPHTMDGQIVVDGVVASIYTRAVAPKVANLLLALPRLAYRLGAKDPLGKWLYSQTPRAIAFVPRGRVSYSMA